MESNDEVNVEVVNRTGRSNKFNNNLKNLQQKRHREKYYIVEEGKRSKHKRRCVRKDKVKKKCKNYEIREKKYSTEEQESENTENCDILEENKKTSENIAGCANIFVEESDDILDKKIEGAKNEIQRLRSKLDYLQKERCQHMKEYEENLSTDDKRRRLLEQKQKLVQVKEFMTAEKFLERETLVSLLDLTISLYSTENTKTSDNMTRFVH